MPRLPAALLSTLCVSAAAQAQLSVDNYPDLEPTNFSYVGAAVVASYQDEARQNSVEPFKIFDNLYYVGIEWVASYLLVTDDGLILIDSLHEPYVETGIRNIRQLGFDPADIKYVLGTQGHFDHMGGHAHYQNQYGARVGLTAGDWKRAQTDADRPFWGMEMPAVDMVIQDEEILELGDQTLQFYVTPGHTEGMLSMTFHVRDGRDEFRAIIFGGGVAQYDDFWIVQTALGNIRRFQALAMQSPPIQVNISMHLFEAGLNEMHERLDSRSRSGPHPLVDAPHVFIEYLDQEERDAQARLSR